VLLAGADRYDEARIIGEDGSDLGGVELLDAEWSRNWNWGGKRHRVSRYL